MQACRRQALSKWKSTSQETQALIGDCCASVRGRQIECLTAGDALSGMACHLLVRLAILRGMAWHAIWYSVPSVTPGGVPGGVQGGSRPARLDE